MRYIELTAEDKELIQTMKLTTHSEPLRRRLECLLLSDQRIKVKDLSIYFGVVPKTIYEWFDLWEGGHVSGILLKEGSGAKVKLRNIPREAILKLVNESPRNLKPVLSQLSATYGVEVSKNTLRCFLKMCRHDLAQGAQVIEAQAQPS